MHIFFAGASGVIGRTFVPVLVAQGHEVTGMTNDPAKVGLVQSLGAHPVVVDAFDRDAMHDALRHDRPQVVLHELTSLRAGGFGGYAANTRVRNEGTRNLVDAALAAGVKRMVAQSYCLYAPGEGLAREGDPLDIGAPEPRRTNVEGVQALEDAVAEVPEAVILRFGTLYGPGTGFAPDGAIAEQVRQGKFATTNDIASFLQIEDAARATALALTWSPGTVNIVDDEPAPAMDWLPVYAAAIGAPSPPAGATSTRPDRGVSNAKARRELSWQPLHPSWRAGFQHALGATQGSALIR